MRHVPALAVVCALAAVALAVHAATPPADPGLPAWALLTFAVSAFDGPVR